MDNCPRPNYQSTAARGILGNCKPFLDPDFFASWASRALISTLERRTGCCLAKKLGEELGIWDEHRVASILIEHQCVS